MSANFYGLTDSLGLFYLIHSMVSFLVALVSAWFLKHKFTDKQVNIILFFWIFNLVLPGIGYLMTIWIVYYLSNVTYEKQLSNINYINMIEFENEFPKINRIFGEAAMGKLLSDDTASSSLKMKALVSLADNSSKTDVMLIKNSLSDKNDEVRLYSFAVIDNIERGINSKIHNRLQLFLETKDSGMKVKAAEELAYLYWDMVYFELTDSDLKKFIIDEVEKYAKIVLSEEPQNEKMNVLLGKTYLLAQEFDKAEVSFSIAIEKGNNKDFVVPYLAEIFFAKRAFSTVKELLNNTKGLHTNALLHPIVKQWSR